MKDKIFLSMRVDCPTQLTLIFILWYLYLITNVKVTNMKNTAGKSARGKTQVDSRVWRVLQCSGFTRGPSSLLEGGSHHRSLYTGLFHPPRALLSTRDPAGCKMQIWNKPRTWRQTSHLFYNSSCVSSENLGGGGLMPVSTELPTGRLSPVISLARLLCWCSELENLQLFNKIFPQ